MEGVKCRRVFLAGCGGGYDIYGGIPHYLKMKSSGDIQITLINYSFTADLLLSKYSEQLTKLLFRVDPRKDVSWLRDDLYFPEQRLANELEVPIYAIICNYDETRIDLVIESYRCLINGGVVDQLILIDCGSDSLLTGNERYLGTPLEDMSHVRAVQFLRSDEVKSKYLVVMGTNIDVGHDVLQSDIDARLNSLSSGSIFTWLWKCDDDEDIVHYIDIVNRCCPEHTIVHSLVCAALKGHRGYYLPPHLHNRIRKSKVSLGENTCLSIGYDLNDVISENIYLEQLTPKMTFEEIENIIYQRKNKVLSNIKVESTVSSSKLNRSLDNCLLSRLESFIHSSENRSILPQ